MRSTRLLEDLSRLLAEADVDLRKLERNADADPSDPAVWRSYAAALARVGQKLPKDKIGALTKAALTGSKALKQVAYDLRKESEHVYTLARVHGDRYVRVYPQHIASGGSHDGPPWLIGLPFGNFVTYRVVFARDAGHAISGAEEEWPQTFGRDEEGHSLLQDWSIQKTKIVRAVQLADYSFVLADGTVVRVGS